MIDRLENGGYVRRTTDPGDRRKGVVEAVPERVHEVAEVFEPSRRHMATLADRYGSDEIGLLFDLFAHATAAFKAATAEIRAGGE
ncbi:DNA-binding MarR family transcriptional regulator [Spinactinospora alkalitolerans]|uniref:DNA-binding MarR family transcriptional regulator n=2 Tax=Spinactinospora alkalitolerans TaxID=687207 RepID=A0A852TMX6_9ACTN|nr:DNA-binding MarR family transcriptional regulator [Spinactinospora alkalitolerans]